MAKDSSASPRRQYAAQEARRDLLRYVLDHPEATCRDAARDLGMSFPNASRILGEFKSAGLVVEGSRRPTGRRGPWSKVVSLRADLGSTIGIDLEATEARGVVLDFANGETRTLRRPIPHTAGPDAIVSTLADLAADLTKSLSPRPLAAGLALPGPILDASVGKIRTDLQFGQAVLECIPPVAERSGVEVFAVPNTHAFAAAHHRLRSREGKAVDMVVLNRFGLGAAIAWEERLFTGEIGLLRCNGARSRRYNDVCTGSLLLRHERAKGGARSLKQLLQTPDDPVVVDWLKEAVPAFAAALCAGVIAYNPDRVLIEGLFNRLPGDVRARVTTLVGEELSAAGLKIPHVEFFEGDDLMGARGAALLARDHVADAALALHLKGTKG